MVGYVKMMVMKGGEKMTLQERMVQYRAKERISRQELAERTGLSLCTIQGVERDLWKPTELTKSKIELVIGKEKE